MHEEASPTTPKLSTQYSTLFHREILEYLKTHESELWQWFKRHRPTTERSNATKLDLLKSTYRIDAEEDASLYELVRELITTLGLNCSCTLYRAQNPQGLNVSIAPIPQEAHIILHGPVQDLLNRDEFRAVLAHELSHYHIYEGWNGELAMAEEILTAMASDTNEDDCHLESLRLFNLYTEILADRGSLEVSGDPLIAISGLLKMETGDPTPRAESYLKQAKEIFAQGATRAEGGSHPESFIRSYALHLWAESRETSDNEIRQIIEGPLCLSRLDLLSQRKARAFTRRLIDRFLTPTWVQTDLLLGHARLFFDDYSPPPEGFRDDGLKDDLATDEATLQNYYSYVLLDFVAVDRELEDAPFALALRLAEHLGIEEQFIEAARKELKLTKGVVKKVRQDRDEIIRLAATESEA